MPEETQKDSQKQLSIKLVDSDGSATLTIDVPEVVHDNVLALPEAEQGETITKLVIARVMILTMKMVDKIDAKMESDAKNNDNTQQQV